MESMSSKFLTENRYPGQPVITPTLDRLSKEGLFSAGLMPRAPVRCAELKR